MADESEAESDVVRLDHLIIEVDDERKTATVNVHGMGALIAWDYEQKGYQVRRVNQRVGIVERC